MLNFNDKILWMSIIVLKAIILLGLAVSCVGCGPKLPLTKDVTTSTEVDGYVEAVLNVLPYEAPFRLPRVALKDNLTYINSEGEEKPAVGVCKRLKNGQPVEILLDTEFWNKSNDLNKISLVSHEMLHCMYGLLHTEEGLMAPFIHQSAAEINAYGLQESVARALEVQ